MQEKKVIETEYMATENKEHVIKLPKLIGNEIIEIISEFADHPLRSDEYKWDKKEGILTLKTKEGLLEGEILMITSVIIESDPTEDRPEP